VEVLIPNRPVLLIFRGLLKQGSNFFIQYYSVENLLFFEFLKNCENEILLKELRKHGERLINTDSQNASTRFKLGIEKLNTLQRLSEWYLSEEFNKEKECDKPVSDDILTVEETARYLKTTTQTIYSLVNKGKLDKCEISTVDKPGARPIIRIKKSDVDNYLNGN